MAAPSPPPAPAMPERYLCPITTEIMVDPVMDLHGHNFERSAIAEWLGRSEECPLSREPIQLHMLYPNLALKEEIAEWLARYHLLFEAAEMVTSPRSPGTSPLASSPPCPPPLASEAGDPWERVDLPQDYYDHLLAIFLSSGCEKGDQTKLKDLCRYMNFVEAMDHLNELLPGSTDVHSGVSFNDFMAFVQKYPPHPTLEYGMSQEEYANALAKFQASDVCHSGAVSREAALALVEDPPLGCSPAALLDALPEGPVTLHDVLGCVKRCRLLVARRRSVLQLPLQCTPHIVPTTTGKARAAPLSARPSGGQRGDPGSPVKRMHPASLSQGLGVTHSPTARHSPHSPGPRPAASSASPAPASPAPASPAPARRPPGGAAGGESASASGSPRRSTPREPGWIPKSPAATPASPHGPLRRTCSMLPLSPAATKPLNGTRLSPRREDMVPQTLQRVKSGIMTDRLRP